MLDRSNARLIAVPELCTSAVQSLAGRTLLSVATWLDSDLPGRFDDGASGCSTNVSQGAESAGAKTSRAVVVSEYSGLDV